MQGGAVINPSYSGLIDQGAIMCVYGYMHKGLVDR